MWVIYVYFLRQVIMFSYNDPGKENKFRFSNQDVKLTFREHKIDKNHYSFVFLL